jgi:hypothetical protein
VLRKFYILLGIALLGSYGIAEATGVEIGSEPQGKLPADVRHAPGGYRSFHFWHSGYKGGK